MDAEALETVDFFTELPPEVVLQIILHLDLEDVFNCLYISREWYSLLSGLEPYWRKACMLFGLYEHVVEKLTSNYPSSKDMLLAARRHRQLITSTPPSYRTLSSGYPFNVHYVCKYAEGDTLAGTIYKDFRPREIVVKKVSHTSVQRTLTVRPIFSKCAENRIVWMHLFTDLMLCASASGLWSLYNIQNGSTLFQWRGEALYDSEIKIGCCDKCLIVCVVKLVVSHNEEAHWDLRIIKVAQTDQKDPRKRKKTSQNFAPTEAKFKMNPQNSDITVRRAPFGKKRVTLLPGSADPPSKGFCHSHTLMLQWAHSVVAHNLIPSPDGTILISRRPSHSYIVSFEQEFLDMAVIKRHGLNTEFTLSNDHQLLGLIFQSHLIVWNVEPAEQLSLAEIELDQYEYEEMKLLSLGHIYSIIGLEFTNGLLVVVNSTGQVVLRCSGFAEKHCRMTPPYIEFLSLLESGWISDIVCPCSTAFPAVTYWNKTNRSVEGIYFGQPSESSDTEDVSSSRNRSWWQRK